MYGRIVVLALDVPQGLVDTGDRTHEYGSTAIETAAVHRLPMLLNLQRILTDQIVGKLLHGSEYRVRPTFDDWLSPTGNPFVRVNFQKQPSGWNEIRSKTCDFQNSLQVSRRS